MVQVAGFFSGLTLLLVGIGIYGTLAFQVTRRTREIGVRMALGAKPASILMMVFREFFWTSAVGLGLGLLIILAVGPLVGSLLFGVSPHDSTTIVAAVLALSVAALTGYVPARRALRVDPMTALRIK